MDGQLHDEFGIRAGHKADVSAALVERICRKITDHSEELVDVEEWDLEDAEVVLVAYGSPARPALRAVKEARSRGIRAGLLKVRILWPFPEKAVDRIAAKARRVIVPEMNVGKICREVERIVAGQGRGHFPPQAGRGKFIRRRRFLKP